MKEKKLFRKHSQMLGMNQWLKHWGSKSLLEGELVSCCRNWEIMIIIDPPLLKELSL